jgi:hypothetical protein
MNLHNMKSFNHLGGSMFRLIALAALLSSVSAFANSVTITTGVAYDENFDAACDAKVQDISSAVANTGVSVTKNVVVDSGPGATGPHCAPNCGPVIRNETCDVILTTGQGVLKIFTAKIKSKVCNVSLSDYKSNITIYQNAYSLVNPFFSTCVIDTVDLWND